MSSSVSDANATSLDVVRRRCLTIGGDGHPRVYDVGPPAQRPQHPAGVGGVDRLAVDLARDVDGGVGADHDGSGASIGDCRGLGGGEADDEFERRLAGQRRLVEVRGDDVERDTEQRQQLAPSWRR